MQTAGSLFSISGMRRRILTVATFVSLVAGALFLPTACMTPERAVRESDATGIRLATEYWQKQTGRTNTFDLYRPADALTLRVALLASARGEQHTVFPKIESVSPTVSTNGELVLSLKDALRIGARNDREFQNFKETVFIRALDLDYQQYQFDTTFSGMILGALSGDMATKRASESQSAGFAKKFENGARLAGRLAFDVASLLRDDWRSAAFSGDLTMTIPLLRGARREVVTEPLTQAERNLVYSIWNFERYRQTYAVSIASGYFTVLRYRQQMFNSMENQHRLELNERRAEMMFKAGRMQRIQVDQAKTDLLNANESVIATRQNYENQLDAFKITLGLPPEGKIVLDSSELKRLEEQMKKVSETTKDALAAYPDEAESCRIALNNRDDLFIVRSEYEDEARNVRVAADDLLPEMTLSGGPDWNRMRSTGQSKFRGVETWDAKVQFDFPWDRRRERNAFRKQLVALERAKRALEAKEDAVKKSVRSGLRSLIAARISYEICVKSMKVAELRVKSNDMFMQSGRSSMRDILEAESALLSARNSLVSAVITWWLSDLELKRDMGVLRIVEDGTWLDG
ncbi:MAG: TolC family protein [Kiritimatiellae bacterium]|nr:TolC family protein [Kiritimatiellia bacterium]